MLPIVRIILDVLQSLLEKGISRWGFCALRAHLQPRVAKDRSTYKILKSNNVTQQPDPGATTQMSWQFLLVVDKMSKRI